MSEIFPALLTLSENMEAVGIPNFVIILSCESILNEYSFNGYAITIASMDAFS